MPTQLVERARPGVRGIGGRGLGLGPSGGGGPSRHEPAPVSNGLVGVAAYLASLTMLVLAITSTYVVRRQQPDWPGLALPAVLWFSTAVLLASSASLEWARCGIQRGDTAQLRRGVVLTGALGLVFLAGQIAAWRQYAAQGVFLASNVHSSFFYVLTAVHGLHVLGGLVALGVIAAHTWQGRYTAGDHTGLVNGAIYWHFLDLLWLYLFALLFWA